MTDIVAALAAVGRRRRYPRGSLVLAEGDDAHEVLVVVAGQVKLSTGSLDGRVVLLDVLGPGDLIGELAAIDGGARSATATALTDVEVLAVGDGAFRAALGAAPGLGDAVLRVVTARLRSATRRQLELGAADALGRVCRRLVEVAERFGHPDAAGRTVVRSPLTQQDLAAWSGLSREAVVKALRTLRTRGWVEWHGRSFVVVDGAALAGRAACAC